MPYLGWARGEVTMMLLSLLLVVPAVRALPDPTNLNSSGVDFVLVFPENIAYYHPIEPDNRIEILNEDSATVEFFSKGVSIHHEIVGLEKVWPVQSIEELRRQNISSMSVHITSDKPITIRTISSKDQSIQSSLIIPTEKLGTIYKIPPVLTSSSAPLLDPSEVPENAPFTIMVINTGEPNMITSKGTEERVVPLAAYEVFQFWTSVENVVNEVEASHPVSVLFGHPCFNIFNCTCGMIVALLDPASDTELNYFIPSEFMMESNGAAFLLVADQDEPIPYSADQPAVQSVGSVVFHRPGLLLSILPEEDFASCFHIQNSHNLGPIQTHAVVVVHKDHKDQVHQGDAPLVDPVWNDIKTTDYVSTSILLEPRKHVFWHPRSLMAIYHLGINKTTLFGNKAPIISKYTSLQGCVLVPEVAYLGKEEMGWVESIHYCKDQGLELAAMDGVELRFLAPKLHASNASLEEVWIGYRRSALTGAWYRVRNRIADPSIPSYTVVKREMADTHWARGEPGEEDEGQCAMMSLDPDQDFGWSDKSCCTAAVPLCYKPPKLLALD